MKVLLDVCTPVQVQPGEYRELQGPEREGVRPRIVLYRRASAAKGHPMSWLLDTCVLSEPARKRPNPRVVQWLADYAEEELFISVLTLATRNTEDMADTDVAVFNPWKG